MLQRISLALETDSILYIQLITTIMVSTLVTSPKTTKEDTVIVFKDIATQDYHNSIKTLKVVVLKELIQEIIGLSMIQM
jgi:hypothetical protein